MNRNKFLLIALAIMLSLAITGCAKKDASIKQTVNYYNNYEKGYRLILPPAYEWETMQTGGDVHQECIQWRGEHCAEWKQKTVTAVDMTMKHKDHLSIIVINSMKADIGGLQLPLKEMAGIAFEGFKQGAPDTRFSKGREEELRPGSINFYKIHFDAYQGGQDFVGDLLFTYQSKRMFLLVLFADPSHYNMDYNTVYAMAGSLSFN